MGILAPAMLCTGRLPVGAVDVVTAFNQAWAAHDLEGALALMSEDCVFDGTGPPPDGTRFVGKDAVRAAWRPILDDHGSRIDPDEMFDADDRVVVLWTYRWSDGHVRGVDVFRVRDGLVNEKFSYVKG